MKEENISQKLEINKIYNMDCLEGLRRLEDNSVDLIITSPPYNFGGFNRNGIRSNYECYNDDLDEEEYKNWTKKYFIELYRVLKPTGMFYFNIKYKFENYECKLPFWINNITKFKLLNLIIWRFGSGADVAKIKWYPRYEYIFVFIKTKDYFFNEFYAKYGDVWEISHLVYGHNERTKHPAQYPLELVRRIISSSSIEGDLILDPFLGSGTTAVACKQLRRNFIGFEISKEYCEIARKRLNKTNVIEVGKWF